MLSVDPERSIRPMECDRCGRTHLQVTLLIYRDGSAHAICYASLYDHDDVHEAWFDVILGTMGEDHPTDHVTFGCRVGPIEGQQEPAASLVTGGIPFGQTELFGRKLTRSEALTYPLLPDFWEVVDFVLMNDPDVAAHVYGHPENA